MLFKKLCLAVMFSGVIQPVFADVDLEDEQEKPEQPELVEASSESETKKPQQPVLSKAQIDALYIGKMVQQLQQAIDSPNDPNSLKTISHYGTDSRYYSMVRGWLFQELVGVESQLYASKNAALSAKFQHHSNFLKKAIRLVDLE